MTLVLYYDSLRHYMCQKRSRFKSIDSHVSGPVGDQVKSLKGYHTHRFRTMQMHQTQAKSLTALRPSRTHLRNFVHTSGAERSRNANSLAIGLWSCLSSLSSKLLTASAHKYHNPDRPDLSGLIRNANTNCLRSKQYFWMSWQSHKGVCPRRPQPSQQQPQFFFLPFC